MTLNIIELDGTCKDVPCEHDKRKEDVPSYCKDGTCGGSQICEHNRDKRRRSVLL